MSHTIEDFRAMRDRQRKTQANGAGGRSLQDVQMVMQAGLSAEAVTNHPAWDKLLSMIEAAIEGTVNQRDGFRVILESPDVVDPNELQKAKIGVISCEERMKAWRVVINLPKQLMSGAEEAIDILEKMDSE